MASSARSWLARVSPPLPVLACMVLAVLNTGGGCGPGGPPLPSMAVVCAEGDAGTVEQPPDPTKPFVWIGTTDASGAYRAIEADEALSVVYGPQGGSHVWGAARLYAPEARRYSLAFALKATDPDATTLASATILADSCAGGIAQVTYVRVFLYTDPPASGVLQVDAEPADEGNAEDPVHAEVPVKVQ